MTDVFKYVILVNNNYCMFLILISSYSILYCWFHTKVSNTTVWPQFCDSGQNWLHTSQTICLPWTRLSKDKQIFTGFISIISKIKVQVSMFIYMYFSVSFISCLIMTYITWWCPSWFCRSSDRTLTISWPAWH